MMTSSPRDPSPARSSTSLQQHAAGQDQQDSGITHVTETQIERNSPDDLQDEAAPNTQKSPKMQQLPAQPAAPSPATAEKVSTAIPHFSVRALNSGEIVSQVNFWKKAHPPHPIDQGRMIAALQVSARNSNPQVVERPHSSMELVQDRSNIAKPSWYALYFHYHYRS